MSAVGTLDAPGLLQLFRQLEGRTLLGALDCGDCIELVFSESGRRPNLVTLWMDGHHRALVSLGGVMDAAEYSAAWHRWLDEAA